MLTNSLHISLVFISLNNCCLDLSAQSRLCWSKDTTEVGILFIL